MGNRDSATCLCSFTLVFLALPVHATLVYRPKLLVSDARFAERNAASLRVMREYVTFTRNQTIPCQNLDVIEQQALDWLDHTKEQPGNRALDVQFIHSLGLGEKYTTCDTCELSEQIMHELLRMATDVTVGEQVTTPPTLRATTVTPAVHMCPH